MTDLGGEWIAIVDDDEGVRSSTQRLLARAGFRVDAYDGGERFLRAAASRRYDCILLDVWMPDLDGLSVLRALGAQPGPVAPVIVLTGHGDVALAVEAMKLGAEAFIEKPYRPELLLSEIRRAITEPSLRMC